MKPITLKNPRVSKIQGHFEPQPTHKTVHEFLYIFSLRHYNPVLVKQPFVLLIIFCMFYKIIKAQYTHVYHSIWVTIVSATSLLFLGQHYYQQLCFHLYYKSAITQSSILPQVSKN